MSEHIALLMEQISAAYLSLSETGSNEIDQMKLIVELSKNFTSNAQSVSIMRKLIALDAAKPTNI